MGAPKKIQLPADFDEWFPQGLYLVGEIQAVTEYQSPEDRARKPSTAASGRRGQWPAAVSRHVR